ncbi:MAG: RDD family protein [Deltaproteobacteria bacterium]|nr:RDD family protein [Deltaproteobacteria bacterium]
MKWLWFAGPLAVILVALFLNVWPPAEERRLRRAVERWIDEFLGPVRTAKGKAKSRRVRRLPALFDHLIDRAGGGTRLTDVVLVPKLAYAAVRLADGVAGSNQFTVLCKLAKPGPSFTCHPLQVIDGRPAENRGIRFRNDPQFTDQFVVEGDGARATRKWLSADLREALMDLPDAWLRVDGRVMALTVYGYADADRLDELVGVADAIFAERGAGGSESLFGEGGAAGAKASSHDAGSDSDEDEADDEPVPTPVRLKAGALDMGLYLLATLVLVAVLGKFESFHPAVLFNSPDLVVNEPWQGGWTTKGFGALVAAESLLVGLFVLQGYLAATRGQSIGKRLWGMRVVRVDGTPVTFWRGLLLRSWLLGLVPLVVAGVMARPFGAREFFLAIPRWPTLAVAAAVVALAAASMAMSREQRGLHDLVAGTKVVDAEPWRLPSIQLGTSGDGVDPLAFKRLSRVGLLLAALIFAYAISRMLNLGF